MTRVAGGEMINVGSNPPTSDYCPKKKRKVRDHQIIFTGVGIDTMDIKFHLNIGEPQLWVGSLETWDTTVVRCFDVLGVRRCDRRVIVLDLINFVLQVDHYNVE